MGGEVGGEVGGEEETVGKRKQAVFLFATFFSVALGVKKFLEWRGVKEDKRNVESWKEIVESRLVEAKALCNYIKGREGAEGPGWGEVLELRTKVARLKVEKEAAEKATRAALEELEKNL